MLAAALHVPLSLGNETSDSCRGLQLDFSEGGVAATGQRRRMGKRAVASGAQKAKWVSSSVTALNSHKLVPWSYSGHRCDAKYDSKSWFQRFEVQLQRK